MEHICVESIKPFIKGKKYLAVPYHSYILGEKCLIGYSIKTDQSINGYLMTDTDFDYYFISIKNSRKKS